MTGFATLAALQTALLKAGIRAFISKGAPATGTTNGVSSYWAGSGLPAAGAAPGSTAAVAPTRSTTGALAFPLASASKVRHLGRAIFGGGNSSYTWGVHDRLLHCDGQTGRATTSQTIGGASAPSRGSFDAHELYVEWYTATGATTHNLTVTYVNQDGATKTTPSVAIPASVGAGRMIHVPLFAGDWQVQSLTSYLPDADTGTTGNFGFTVVRRLATCGADRGTNRPPPLDALMLGVPKVPDDSCVFFTLETSSSASMLSANGLLWFPETDP